MASHLKASSSLPLKCIFVAMVTLPAALACMCTSSHPQEQFCKADFVLSGHVLEKTAVNDIRLRGRFGQFHYTVNVERVYKGNGSLKEGVMKTPTPVEILTSPGDSLCGPHNLKLDTKYLITGKLVDGELHISSCDWVEVWRDVTIQQRQGLKNFYRRYCDQCMIQSTMRAWRSNNPSTATSGCIYDPMPTLRNGVEDCQALYATCVMQEDRSCGWYHRGDDYQRCVERNRPYYQGTETAQAVDFPIRGEILT